MSGRAKPTLRDRREPGHFWADNEIFDVFGDALGTNGILVYMTLARHCYGTTVKLSLRDIAAEARMGKDRVARALKVLTELGLVIEAKSERTRAVSSWSLTNVKKLAREYVPAALPSVDTCVAQPDQNCLTVRQMEAPSKKIGPAQGETDLSRNCTENETDLSHGAVPSNSKKQDTKLQETPLPPSGARGELPASGDDALTAAVATVLRECNLSDRRMAGVVLRALQGAASRSDVTMSVEELAAMAVRKQREYASLGARGQLKFTVRMRRFFADGLWCDDGLWAVDWDRVRQMQRL